MLIHLEQGFSARREFVLRGYLVISGDIFGYHNQGGGGLLASNEWRPGMLLDILQCTGWPPPQQRMILPHTSAVLRLRSPDLDLIHF